jgi:hypothetical protein
MLLSWRRMAAVLLPLAWALPARAQVTDTLRLGERQRQPPAVDTAGAYRAAADTGSGRVTPRGAFLRSLVLPGWGQSAIGAPGRGAVYFGLESASLWMVYKSSRKLSEARRLESVRHESGDLAIGQNSGLVRARRNEQEDWITLSVFWFFFAGADAYVSAHLRDWDAHVNAQPAPGSAMQLEVNVPLGRR